MSACDTFVHPLRIDRTSQCCVCHVIGVGSVSSSQVQRCLYKCMMGNRQNSLSSQSGLYCEMTHRFPVEIWQQGPRLLWCVQSSMFMEGHHTVAKHRDTSRARSDRKTSQNNKQHGFFVVGSHVETATAVFLLRMCLESRDREH